VPLQQHRPPQRRDATGGETWVKQVKPARLKGPKALSNKHRWQQQRRSVER
jgi:hypothetical protein